MINTATPFTSSGARKRSIVFEFPPDPMRSKDQRFKLALLDGPVTSRVPSYCCDLDSPRFCDSRTICPASWPNAPPITSHQPPTTSHHLLIFQRLNQRPAHCGFRRTNCRNERNGQNHRGKQQANLKRIFVVEPDAREIFACDPQAVVKLNRAECEAENQSHRSNGERFQPNGHANLIAQA